MYGHDVVKSVCRTATLAYICLNNWGGADPIVWDIVVALYNGFGSYLPVKDDEMTISPAGGNGAGQPNKTSTRQLPPALNPHFRGLNV
jgi:hypothetical protein